MRCTRGGQHFRFIKIPFFVTWVAMYCGFILVQSLWYLIWQSQKATPTFPFEGLSKNWWCCCKPVWWSCSLPHFLSFPTSEVQIVVPCLSIGDLHIQCFSQRLPFGALTQVDLLKNRKIPNSKLSPGPAHSWAPPSARSASWPISTPRGRGPTAAPHVARSWPRQITNGFRGKFWWLNMG